ncbi:MAG: T9SS type A sorting domain-containing protein [Aquaticitalea sp.]
MKNFYVTLVLSFFMVNSWSQEYRKMILEGTFPLEEIQQAAEAHFAIVGTERGKGYKPYKRWEYNALRNMDENGMLKTPEFYFNELEDYNNYINRNFQTSQLADTGSWEQLGPVSWNATSGWNPGVGRVTSIAVDKLNTNHIIVGANTGGVWKTLDGGATWTVLTDNLSNLNVYALTMDPTNSSTYFWGSSGGAIFKSIDDGATWDLWADTGNGNVNKILIDPNNTNKMFCTVESGGIYKSTNAGLDWSLIAPGVSTGFDVEFKPGDTNVIYASGNQFYISTDGGANFSSASALTNWDQQFVTGSTTWSSSNANQNGSVAPRTGNNLALFYRGDFSQPTTRLVSPSMNLTSATNPVLKFSYTQANWSGDQDELKVLYKTSADGNWIQLANYTNDVTNWTDITLSLPATSSTYYIAFEGKANYGYGITLDDISVEDTALGIVFEDGFEASTNQFSSGPKMIGVSPADPAIVYVLEADSGLFGGFHKSTNSGATFTKLNHAGKNYFGYSSQADDDRGQAPRDMDIAVNPSDANEVHIAGILTWRSTDGGIVFNVSSQWTPYNAANENIGYCHADVDIMEFVGDRLFVGTDGGIFVANNVSTVNSNYYTDLTPGLGIRQFYRIGISQTNPVVVTGGSQDNGTSVYSATGEWTDWLGADGMESFVDKNNSNTLYGTTQQGGLWKSLNGGNTVFDLNSPNDLTGNWITPFEQDPITQNVIYTGYNQVFKSVNGGNSWTSVSQNFGGNLNEMKVAPSNGNFMYASRGSNLYKNNFVGIVTDWTQLSGFAGSVNSIAIHPTDPNKVAIATTGAQKVYVSTNGGSTWTSYRFDLPNFSALALVWAGNTEDGLYLGMNYGVYYIDSTTNSSWLPFSNNLPNVQISELEINYVDNKLYAGTYGRGLWRTNIYDPTLSVSEFELNGISLFPNPAKKEVNLVWDQNDDVNIKIFNSLGKLMYYSKNQNTSETFKIDVSQYASGLYFVKINNSKGEITKKLMVN